MIIDLHIHSKPTSMCSKVYREEAVQFAKFKNLDGICFMEHDIYDDRGIEELGKKYNIKIFAGMEVTCVEGHFLTIGLKENISPPIYFSELVLKVKNNDGIIIVPHPYRMSVPSAGDFIYEIKNQIDGIEVLNGNSTDEENLKTIRKAKELKLKMTGGSDGHRHEKIGIYATKFYERITNEKQLISAIKTRKIMPVKYIENHGYIEVY